MCNNQFGWHDLPRAADASVLQLHMQLHNCHSCVTRLCMACFKHVVCWCKAAWYVGLLVLDSCTAKTASADVSAS
jgi:hypothetical protein